MKRTLALVAMAATSTLALGGLLAAPAAAKTCGTLTKKEASEIVGFKVVATKELSQGDVKGCDYVTKKYFKDISSPLRLRLTVEPLTPKTEGILTQLESDEDAETVEGLGDRAFYSGTDALIAVAGDQVFQAKISNVRWSGNEHTKLVLDPEREAMEALVANAT